VRLLQERTPENLSSLITVPFLDNVTIYSWMNLSDHSYFDHIYNRTRNANRTIDEGMGLWMLSISNFTFDRNTGYCLIYNWTDGSCLD